MNSHGKMPRKRTVPCDGITSLPEEIITERILGRLSLRDAVKTSILSRDWRLKWNTLPDLIFDDPPFSSQLRHNGELVEIISSILLQHKGPIRKFSCSIDLIRSLRTKKNLSKIDHWLRYLSNNSTITEFILRFDDRRCKIQYEIHSSLFSCANLRHLELKSCVVPLPATFNGFNDLTYLKLHNVEFTDDDFENLIAKCPQLSKIFLVDVVGLRRLNFQHAPKLEYLNFRGERWMKKQILYTPSLSCVKLSLDLSWEKVSPHQNPGNGKPTSLINNLNCFSNVNVQKIVLESHFSIKSNLSSFSAKPQMKTATEYLEVRSGSIGSFMQLRYVVISTHGSGPEMQIIKMILVNTPLLEEMKVYYYRGWVDSKIMMEFPRASPMVKFVCIRLRLQL